MLSQAFGKKAREADRSPGGACLQGFLDAKLTTFAVHQTHSQCGQLARSQPRVGAREHERSPSGLDRFGECIDLGRVKEPLLVLLKGRKADPPARGAGNPTVLYSQLENHLQQDVRPLHR